MIDKETVRRVTELQRVVDDRPEPEVIGRWDFIDETVLAADAATVTLANIPQNYRTLVLVSHVRSTRADDGDSLYARFNGDSGNNYDWLYMYYNSAAGATGGQARARNVCYLGNVEGANSRADNYSGLVTWFPGYSMTDQEKWVFTPNSGPFGDVSADADLYVLNSRARWRNTNAITSIQMRMLFGNISDGSCFTLYGVL
jgi:hypothetical protein